jgi:hypothetical protein
MSKNLATFSYVKPFTRTAEMPAGIFIGILDAFVKRIEAVSSKILKFLG